MFRIENCPKIYVDTRTTLRLKLLQNVPIPYVITVFHKVKKQSLPAFGKKDDLHSEIFHNVYSNNT